MDRVNELLKREIAAALFRVMSETGFDLSAVTITRVQTSSNLRSARVMVSIRDHENERSKMMGRLERHRTEIQQIIHDNVVLKYTPHLTFEIDSSIEEGDRVLSIISQIETTLPAEETSEEEPSSDKGEDENG
ncbi:MAG: ribosome-binding factor A [Lentisphaerae bacterium GWF2_57_35]|nr:MAG: ribosome-binding factor A [Lentisphaerae bacterium GWF2_57_35]